MFSKLLKHEMKATAKPMIIASIASLVVSLVNMLIVRLMDFQLYENEQSDWVIIFALLRIFVATTFIAFAIYGVVSIIMLYYRFYRHHFTDEGYLTFTIPATAHQILLSSIVNILIWTLFISIVILLSAMLTTGTFLSGMKDITEALKDVGRFLANNLFNEDDFWMLLFSVVTSWLYRTMLPLVAITIGCLVAKKHKLLCAFGIGYGIHMLVNIITTVTSTALMMDSLANSSNDTGLNSVLGEAVNSYELFTWLQGGFYLALAVGGYFLMQYLVQKKLNL